MNEPTNEDWLRRLQVVECHDSTYPVSSDNAPLVFAKAQGPIVEDVAGRRLIDLCGGFGALPFGHNPPHFKQVLAEFSQSTLMAPVEHGMGDVYPSLAKIEFLETLMTLMPSHLRKAALALTGSQAVEIALKTAMLHTKRSGFLTFSGSYHGVDLGVLPVTARQDFSAPFATWLASATTRRIPFGAQRDVIRSAIAELAATPSGFAGIIVEPIQGRAGNIAPPPRWLGTLLAEAHAAGGLLIFDEVFTGLGRLGLWTQASEVEADLVCFGKALGGGMPLSACVGTKACMDAWPKSTGEAIHTGTFFGHPLTCAVATANLKAMIEARLPEIAAKRGKEFLDHLNEHIGTFTEVKAIRGCGMFFGIEFDRDGRGAVLMDRLRQNGVVALVSGARGHVLSLTPPLNLDIQVWRQAVGVLKECLLHL